MNKNYNLITLLLTSIFPICLIADPMVAVGPSTATADIFGYPGLILAAIDNSSGISTARPFGRNSPSAIRVALADFNADGVFDLVMGRGKGFSPLIRVLDGNTLRRLDGFLGTGFNAFNTDFRRGVFVATGDISNDGVPDIIVGAGGVAPQVNVFDGTTGNQLFFFFAYDQSFKGGVRVAVGDINGDGINDIITAPGKGMEPQVKIFSNNGALLNSFLAFDTSFTGGVFVAAGDVNGDNFDDVIVGAGAGLIGPEVKVFDDNAGSFINSFFAYPQGFRGGVTVSAADVNADGRAEIITGAGPGRGPQVKIFDGLNGAKLDSFFAFDRSYSGGVFVAGGN